MYICKKNTKIMITEEPTFEVYLKQARWDFAKVAGKYPVEKHLELRTEIDSLLIAYDQAVHQALTRPDVVDQHLQLVCPHCKGLEVYIDEYGGKPCKCTKQAN